MAETGFGSITLTPAPAYNDWGFGSPTPIDLDSGEFDVRGRDTAFGSPFDAVQSGAYLTGEFDLIPDDGGVILEINNDWSLAGFYDHTKRRIGVLFPFQVTFIEQSTGATFDAIGEVGNNCVTNGRQDKLYAGVPPLPHGAYDVRVSWFDGVRSIYISSAFSVVTRDRCIQAYGLRKHLPSWLATGATALDFERVGEFEGYDSNIEILTKCIGDTLQRLYGRHTTALAQDLQRDDLSIAVESTLGFPNSGRLSIEGVSFSYSSKDNTTFYGVQALDFFNTLSTGLGVSYVESI